MSFLFRDQSWPLIQEYLKQRTLLILPSAPPKSTGRICRWTPMPASPRLTAAPGGGAGAGDSRAACWTPSAMAIR